MARQKCRGCGQFAGSFHKCPAVAKSAPAARGAAPALPAVATRTRVTSADVTRVKGMSELVKIQMAVLMEQAMIPATSAVSVAARDNTRKLIEAQFGPIDWAK